MADKITFSNLSERLQGNAYHLLGRISFESRSIAVPCCVSSTNWVSKTLFLSRRRSETAESNLQAVLRHFSKDVGLLELNVNEPLEVARCLQTGIDDFFARAMSAPAIIDITSFRREELLMLLAVLKLKDLERCKDWYLAYVGAENMGEWLSGKVTAYRSVLGFPGDIRPSRSTCLVVLMGFEVARARSIIESYEPKRLILGMGRKSESITDGLYHRNRELFQELVQEFRTGIEREFEFSAREPVSVKKELQDVILPGMDRNVIMAPLHTKLSTVGAGLYALEHPEVQICYAPVEEYNEIAYSAPGKIVYLVSIRDLFA